MRHVLELSYYLRGTSSDTARGVTRTLIEGGRDIYPYIHVFARQIPLQIVQFQFALQRSGEHEYINIYPLPN